MATDPRTPRGRKRWPVAATAAASLVAVGLVAAPAQAQVVECTGIIENTTINGSVSVPGGEACLLTSVMVVGEADVGAGADLLMEQTVVGAVTAASGAFVAAEAGSVIAGGIVLNQSFGALVQDSIIFDGVAVNGSPFVGNTLFLTERTNIVGNVQSESGSTVLSQGFLHGYVDTLRDEATDLLDVEVAGSGAGGVAAPQDVSPNGVKVRDTTKRGSVVCGTTINGDLDIRGAQGGHIQIGGTFPVPKCLGNVLRDDLELHRNTVEEIQVSANTIFGNANCTNNSPPPVGHGNIIFGTASGQCANLGRVQEGLIPPPGSPGEKEAVRPEDRIAALAGPLQARLADARAKLGTGPQ